MQQKTTYAVVKYVCEPRWDEVFANNRLQIVPPGVVGNADALVSRCYATETSPLNG